MTYTLRLRNLIFAFLVVWLYGCGVDAERLAESAQSHLSAGREREAAIELRSAVAAEPDHPRANFLLGKLLAKVGSLVDAEIVLRQSLKSGYPASEVIPVLGDVLLEAEKYSALLKTLESIETGGDQRFAAQLALLRGQALAGSGRLLEARTQFTLAAPLIPDRSRVALTELLAASGDVAAAMRELEAITLADAKNADAWLAMAMLLRRLGRDDDAFNAFGRVLEVAPQNTVALLGQAIIYITRDDLVSARPLLDRAGTISPLKPMFEFANGLLALKEKRTEDTRAALQRLLDAVPTYRPALLLAGALNYSTERFDLAENSYAAYLRFEPDHAFARKMLAATLLAKGRPDAALQVLSPVAEKARDAEILILFGRASLALGRVPQALTSLQQATTIAPDNVDARINLAYVNLVAGRRDSAARDFEAAIRLRPDDPRASRGYCMMLLADGRLERAAGVASAFLDKTPMNPDAHALAGAVELARRNDAGAAAYFERALALAPTFIPAAEALADIDQRRGMTDALQKRMDAVLAADPKNLDAILIRVRIDLNSADSVRSASRMRELLGQHPRSLRALLLLAEFQLKSGEVAQGMSTARRAIDEHPWDTQALFLLADAQMASGDAAGAIVTLEKALALAPMRIEPQIKIANAYLQSGDLRTAISKLNAILRLDRSNVAAQLMLGRAYLASKRPEDALAIARALQRTSPRHYSGYRLEGEVSLETRAASQAVQAFTKADALLPNGEHKVRLHRARSLADGKLATMEPLHEWLSRFPSDNDVRLYLADNLMISGEYSAAGDQYRILLKAAGESAHILNNLAWCELHIEQEGRLTSALDYAQRASKLRPDDPRILDTLGVVLMRSKQNAEAVQILLRAKSKDPADSEIRLHLGEALLRVGDSNRGRSELSDLANQRDVPDAIRRAAQALLSAL